MRKIKRLKNPIDVSTDIIPSKKRGDFDVKVTLAHQPLYDLDVKGTDDAGIVYIAEIAERTIRHHLSDNRLKNPTEIEMERFRESIRKGVQSWIGMPENKEDAFELGRLYGIDYCIKELCGNLNFFKRRKMAKILAEEMGHALKGIAKKIDLRVEGQPIALPVVKSGGK